MSSLDRFQPPSPAEDFDEDRIIAECETCGVNLTVSDEIYIYLDSILCVGCIDEWLKEIKVECLVSDDEKNRWETY